MMFTKSQCRKTWRQISESATGRADQQAAADKFVRAFRYQIGLEDENGNRYGSDHGVPYLRPDAPLKLTAVSMRELTEAVLGDNWQSAPWMGQGGLPNPQRVFESEGGGAGPSVFANVAAWSGATAGLYAAQFIDAYNNQPELKARALFPDRKAEIFNGGQRLIDIFPPYAPLPAVGPLQEAPSLKLDALWVETSGLIKRAGKIELAMETAAIDISSGQFLAKMKMAAGMAALAENEMAISLITGQTNNFKIGFLGDSAATAYNTYGPTIAGTAIPNDLVNPCNDIGAFTISDQALTNYIHPVSGWPMAMQMDTAIVPQRLYQVFQSIAAAESTAALTQIVATAFQQPPASGLFPTFMTNMGNPYRGMFKQVIGDQFIDFRHKLSTTQTDPNRTAGLGLTDATAYRWYRLNPAMFACRLVGWEAQTLDLQPNDYIMAVRAVAAGQVVNIASTYQVINPWAIQRNKTV